MCSHAERISSVCLAKPGTTSVRQLVCFAATSRADIFDCVTWCKPAGHSISKLPLHIDKAAAQLYYQAAEPKISIVFLISCMFMSFTLNLVVRPRLLDSLDPYCLTTSTTCSPLCDHRHRPLGTLTGFRCRTNLLIWRNDASHMTHCWRRLCSHVLLPVIIIIKITNKREECVILTTIPFRDTQQSGGKSCRRGTRYWRQPSQWHRSSIIPIKLNILTTALARS